MNTDSFNFNQIVKEYTPMMYNIAHRLLGNKEETVDVLQETFMKVYKNRDKFSAEKNLKNWLYTITLNTARDSYRRKKRKAEVSSEFDVQLFAKDNLEISIDNKLILEKLLGLLSMELREVVVLFYFEEKPVSDVAKILEIKESLVKTRLFRARKQMLEEFKRLNHDL